MEATQTFDPEISNSFEFGHLWYIKGGSLLSSAYHRYRTNLIERVKELQESGQTLFIPINLGKQHAFGLEFNANYNPTPKWNINGNVNLFGYITSTTRNNQPEQFEGLSLQTRVSSKLKIKGADIQMALQYRAPEENIQGKSFAMYWVDAGVSKDVLKGNGTLTLSVRDLFNTRKWHRSINEPGYQESFDFQWRSRQINLSFFYRLNQTKKQKQSNGGFESDDMGF
ncbi:MAG: TonB-dependent receptor [Bacteroidales bacterium]|nr:TonB-dependent receptor [Bacteroidales bacterium]